MYKPYVLILGGGFAGLACAKSLRRTSAHITIVDKQTQHTFSPLLYQVATAGLTAADISAPLRNVLRKQNNTRVLLDEAENISLKDNTCCLKNYGLIYYDYLVIATGLQQSYFGNDHWQDNAPGLKTIDDAMLMRKKMLLAFERAEASKRLSDRENYLTFIVVGGGPTGVELAGAIKEVALHTLVRDFSNIDPKKARVILIEGSSKILNNYPDTLSDSATKQLNNLGVEIIHDSFVSDVRHNGVLLSSGKFIKAGCVFWGAGVKGTPLAEKLEVPLTKVGRVKVEKDLSIPGHENVFVVGDLAFWQFDSLEPVPAVAPAAIQMGRFAASNIKNDLKHKSRKCFRYLDKGSLATIGRHRAVGQIMGIKVTGFFAWLVWSLVHLMTLVDFKNRIFVFFKWFWHYITWKSSARVVLGVKAEDLSQSEIQTNNDEDE